MAFLMVKTLKEEEVPEKLSIYLLKNEHSNMWVTLSQAILSVSIEKWSSTTTMVRVLSVSSPHTSLELVNTSSGSGSDLVYENVTVGDAPINYWGGSVV